MVVVAGVADTEYSLPVREPKPFFSESEIPMSSECGEKLSCVHDEVIVVECGPGHGAYLLLGVTEGFRELGAAVLHALSCGGLVKLPPGVSLYQLR